MPNKNAAILIIFALIWGASLDLNIRLAAVMGTDLFLTPTFMAAYLALNFSYHRRLKKISFAEVGRGILLGMILFGLARVMLIEARTAAAPSALAGLGGLAAIVVPLSQLCLALPRPNLRLLIAVAAAGAGSLLLCGLPGPAGLAAAGLLAGLITMGSIFARNHDAQNILIIALAAATFVSLLTAGHGLPEDIPLMAWVFLALNAVINCGFGLAALGNGLADFTPTRTAVLISVQCITARIIQADLTFPERPELAGFFLICAAVILGLPATKNPIDKACN